MVIELMGNHACLLTYSAGLAGGADIILIPEIPYDLESICQHLIERRRRGKWFSIVAVAEGARPKRPMMPADGETSGVTAALAAAMSQGDGKDKKKKKHKKDRKNKLLPEMAGG